MWTLYKMYKNEGLLLYVIAVLYFVLLRFLWSKTNNIFYERFLISTSSLTLYLNSHYLCAKWNGNMEIIRKKKKKCYHWSNFNFLFLYELYRKDKNIVPFHQCQLSVVCVDFEREKAKTQSFWNRYICHLVELLGKNVWDRFVIAPFVYSTCKMSIPDGNYSISTYFSFFLREQCS